jgi:hypothetical protein
LYQNLYATEEVEFTCGLPGFLYNINDVFDLFDDDYAATAVSGRVVSATSSSVTLDQAVTISGTTSKIGVLLPDGVTYETHTISNSAGTYTTLNISGTWSVTPTKYCVYGVSSAVLPRQFKMTDLKYDGVAKTVTCSAQIYNSANYTYVQTGVSIPAATYTLPSQLAPGAPTGLTTTATQYINPVNYQLSYGVTLNWTPPTSQNIAFIVKWRKDNGQYNTAAQTRTASYALTNIVDGVYNFLVYSVNLVGNISAPSAISYTLNTSGGGTSTTLTDVSSVTVVGGGTGWTGLDMPVTWTNPTANQGLLKDFLVTFSTTGGTQLRQVVVAAVNGGIAQSYLYTYAMNQTDGTGTPNRSIIVKVQCRDSQNHLTSGTSATLTNAAPVVPSNITATPGLQNCIISWTPETGVDVAGYIVWYSTTNGFTPSSSNATDCGNTAVAAINGLAKNTSYYYVIACYDVFGKSLSGTGLNLSSQLSFTTPSSVGISSGSSLPTSGMMTGDTFYLTTTNTLYKYTGSAWVAVGIQVGSTLPSSGMSTGDTFFLTTNNKLYRYTGSAWTTAVDGSDITANTIAANSIITGSLTTTQISSNTILGSNIAGGTILGSNIAGATITGGNIVASTITAGLLTISTLSAITANVGTLTAGTISNNSGTNTINLSATGSSYFINTPHFTVTAAGNATFAGTLSGAIVNAGNINVSSLSAINANIGAATAGTLTFTSATSYILFNNGTYMKVSGVGFGAASNYLEWFGPTVSTASNFAACTDSNAKYYLKTNGSAYFGGQLSPIITRTYTYATPSGTEVVPYGVTSCTILAYGGGGGGAATSGGAYNCGGGGGAGFSQLTIAVSAGQTIAFTVGQAGLNGVWISGTGVVNPGYAGTATTASGTVTGGTISISAGGGGGGTATTGGTAGTASGGTYNINGTAGTVGAPGHGGNAGTGGGLGGTTDGKAGGNGGGGGASDNSGGSGGPGGPGYIYFSYN